MVGPWQRALDEAKQAPSFLDLTDSQFHQNGLLPDRELFETGFRQWLDIRNYQPDSRGAPAARQTLAAFYTSHQVVLSADQFFLTAGTSEAYSLLFSTLARAGDAVALPRPGYPLFEQIAQHTRLDTVFYNQPWSLNWQPDAHSLEACLTVKTKFVVVISPNNPTGQTISAASLSSIAEVCRRHDLILIVDEVFDACWEGPGPLPRPAALFQDVKTFTLNGISKRFGSPDLKLAWIAVSGPEAWATETCDQLEIANDTFLSANSFSQFLLPKLFMEMDAWQLRLRSMLDTNRLAVEEWMCGQNRVSGISPRGGIHGLWRFDQLPVKFDDETWSVWLLDHEKLALHPGFFYDVQESGVWLVYSILKEPARFREGLGRLTRALEKLRP